LEWLREFKEEVTTLKEKKDLIKSESEMKLKIQNAKCTRKIVPISLLIFVIVVIFSALGILFFKIFGQSSSGDTHNHTSNQNLKPVYSFGMNGNNLLFNPSFEDIDIRNGKITNWESKSLIDLLTTEGVSNDKGQVFPEHENKSLQLSNFDASGIVIVTQYLYPADIPKAIYFSGWGNGDLLDKTDITDVKFMLSFTLEYNDNKKYIYTLAYNNTISGWQFDELYVYEYDFEPESISAMYIRCSLLYGIGLAFFDNVTVNFLF